MLQSTELISYRSMSLLAAIIDQKNDTYDQTIFNALLQDLERNDRHNDLAKSDILLMLQILIKRNPAFAKAAVIPVSQLVITTKLMVFFGFNYQDTYLYRTLGSIINADLTTIPQALKVANEGLVNSQDQICLNSLQLLIYLVEKAPAYCEPIFQLGTELVLAIDKNWEIRDRALSLIDIIAEDHPAYSQKALDIATQAFKDKDVKIRRHALSIFKMLVKTYQQQYIPQACDIAKRAVEDKKDEVRRENIYLLAAILQTDPSYGQKPNFRSILEQAKIDKNKDIRKLANELLSTLVNP